MVASDDVGGMADDKIVGEVVRFGRVDPAVESKRERVGLVGEDDIGGNATASEDGAALRSSKTLSAVDVEQRSAVGGVAGSGRSVDKILDKGIVIVVGALVIWALDAAAGGRIIAGDGEEDGGAIGERELALDKALAEGASPEDEAAVVVLDSAGHNFGSGGRILVDKDDERALFEKAAGGGILVIVGPFVAAFGRDDEAAGGEELVGDGDGGIEHTAAIATEVEDKASHTLTFEFGEGSLDLVGGRLAELGKADIARRGVDHASIGDGRGEDHIAADREGEGFRPAKTEDRELDRSALGAADQLDDIGVVHLDARDLLAVDSEDTVAREDARIGRRAIRQNLSHSNRVVEEMEDDAGALEITLERLGLAAEFIGVEITAMRVEGEEHAIEHSIDERVVVEDIVDIILRDDIAQPLRFKSDGVGL